MCTQNRIAKRQKGSLFALGRDGPFFAACLSRGSFTEIGEMHERKKPTSNNLLFKKKKISKKICTSKHKFLFKWHFFLCMCNCVIVHSNQTIFGWRNASTYSEEKKQMTQKQTINFPGLPLLYPGFVSFSSFLHPQLYLYDLFNCRVLNVKSEEKRFI